jgi:serine/threonine protein kinase/Tfp pilus assembly protein PilF
MIHARHWHQLKSIIADALEHGSTTARVDFIRRSCAEDADLFQAAGYVLAQPDMFRNNCTDALEQCANAAAPSFAVDSTVIGKRIGAYVVVRRIGEGGMGAVYLAERVDGCFEKQVAIKLLTVGVTSEEAVRRFQSERKVLARLDHPNIARMIDAGTTGDEVPYFIMEYIDGIPLTTFLETEELSFTARLKLFLKIAGAVQAAHDHGIIHRDLKPSNILVNGEGEPKLLDFGIAKQLDAAQDIQSQTTSGGDRLSPLFASPEQVKGEAVTTSSDIYSLGVVLYQILTGCLPFRLPRCPLPADVFSAICNQLPTLPSRAGDNGHQRRQLRGDFDAILLRAMQKAPSARYLSVAEFADDVRRHLEGRPVRARSHQKVYRFIRMLFRKRRKRFFAAIAALLLAGGGFVLIRLGPLTRDQGLISGAATSDMMAEGRFSEAWQLAAKGSEPDAKESLLKAVALLNEAVRRDPHFVRAYTLLTSVNLDLYWQGFDHTPARRDLARAAIENAARWNPDAAEVHIARGILAYHGFRDYANARAELEKARSKLPNNATIYSFLGSIDRRQGRWNESLRNSARAMELGPGNFRFHEERAFTLETLRHYADASRTYELSLGLVPENHFVRTQLARIPFLERGELRPLHVEISKILSEQPAAAREIALAMLDCAISERDPFHVDRALAAVPEDGVLDTYTLSRWSRDWLAGMAARAFGDFDKARSSFLAARTIEEKALKDRPDDAPAWSRLGLIDAGLGNKEDAIREGRRACELLPFSQDAWDGAGLIIALATIYAWTGERDLAIQQLEIISHVPSPLSYGELKRSPKWDALRGDPKFEAVVEHFAAPIKPPG